MTGFLLLGGVFLAILSAFYLKQIPGKDAIEALSRDLRLEFRHVLEPEEPLEIKLVPAERKGQQMSLRVRCALREKLPFPTAEPHRDALRQIGEVALRHPAWKGRVAFVSVRNEAEPKLAEKVRPPKLDRMPVGQQRVALPSTKPASRPAVRPASRPVAAK